MHGQQNIKKTSLCFI